MKAPRTRRFFLIAALTSLGVTLGALLRRKPATISSSPLSQSPLPAKMPERILGKTGISLPILGLGGAGQTPLSWDGKEKEARAIIETAISLGIRYFDTAASYGPSEDYLGKVITPYRRDIFLATKTSARDRDGAWRDLERSLERLRTDYLDLWQFHHVSFAEELEQIFSPQGASRALEEAREQKIVRFSGITAHHEPEIVVSALERYPFDTTLISINAADIHHPRPFSTKVLPVALAHNVGVIAMKVPAYGKLLQAGVLKGMEQAMGYVLSLEGVHSCIIAAENPEQLSANVRVAQAFQVLSQQDLQAIELLSAQVWEQNTFFRRWT